MKAPTSSYEKTIEFLKMLYGSSLSETSTHDNWIYVYWVNDPKTIGPGKRISLRTLTELEGLIRHDNAICITPNQFFKEQSENGAYSRDLMNVAWINSVTLSFEDCKSVQAVVKRFEFLTASTGFKPTMIDKHEKGYNAWFLFDGPVALTPESKGHYGLIHKALIMTTGAAPIVRMPSTYERVPRDIQVINSGTKVNFGELQAWAQLNC